MKKLSESELKRNNSVVNDLDVGQREEEGAGFVAGSRARQRPDKGAYRP